MIDRRGFGLRLAAGAAGTAAGGAAVPGGLEPAGALTDVAGLKIGHFADPRRPTGCTVVLAERGAVCGVDVRGGAPGTRETDALSPVNTVEQAHAVLLSGGSAFGLDAASGVVRWLEERGIGFAVGAARVPIVPAAILFDLALGDWKIRPDAAAGYAACQAARERPLAEGSVGVGTGATVGKLLGLERAMKGGLGTASIRRPDGLVVAALVAVNAAGDVVEPRTGRILAGARVPDGSRPLGTLGALISGQAGGLPQKSAESTSIGVVATNATLTKTQATKVAQMAHDGLARTIQPVHTPWDGDTLFALATGERTGAADVLAIGALAAEAVARAVVRAVKLARGLPGLPSWGELAWD